MKQSEPQILKKVATIFSCKFCDYTTIRKSSYNKHIVTMKHMKQLEDTKFKCPCGESFNSRTTLWRHKKNCDQKCRENELLPDENELCITNENENVNVNANVILELIKQNQEFKQLIIEQNTKITELASKPTTINNVGSNNKTKFNLQVFLNDTCKNALNLTDFVNSINLQLTDLEKIGSNGYVNGLSNIIINNLKALDFNKRPVHCSDIKREIMYVKEENKWEKENDEKENLTKAIKKIAHQNILQIPSWQKEHPGCEYSNNKNNDDFLKIVNESMGALTEQENAEYINKIIKNVSKEVLIEKEITESQ